MIIMVKSVVFPVGNSSSPAVTHVSVFCKTCGSLRTASSALFLIHFYFSKDFLWFLDQSLVLYSIILLIYLVATTTVTPLTDSRQPFRALGEWIEANVERGKESTRGEAMDVIPSSCLSHAEPKEKKTVLTTWPIRAQYQNTGLLAQFFANNVYGLRYFNSRSPNKFRLEGRSIWFWVRGGGGGGEIWSVQDFFCLADKQGRYVSRRKVVHDTELAAREIFSLLWLLQEYIFQTLPPLLPPPPP